jgi:hypothetical protein
MGARAKTAQLLREEGKNGERVIPLSKLDLISVDEDRSDHQLHSNAEKVEADESIEGTLKKESWGFENEADPRDTAAMIVDALGSSEQVIDEVKALADEAGGMDALAHALDAKTFLGKARKVGFESHGNDNTENTTVSAVIAAMRNHRFNDGVQAQGCEALKKMARCDEDKVAIGQAGGIIAVIVAMRYHPSNGEVQERGIATLMALVDLNLAVTNKNKRLFFARGGIYLIVDAMLNLPSNSKIQANGCGAFWMLAYKVSNKLAIVTADVMHAVVHAMRNHPFIAIVQGWGGRALMLAITESPLAAVTTAPLTQGASTPTIQKAQITKTPQLSSHGGHSLSVEVDSALKAPSAPGRKYPKAAYNVIMTEDYDKDGKLVETRFEVHDLLNFTSAGKEAHPIPTQTGAA